MIDGKEYELREKDVDRKWSRWEKITTWTATGLGAAVGVYGGAFAMLAVDFSGAITPATCAAFAVGMLICAGAGYLTGRGASNAILGVSGWFR